MTGLAFSFLQIEQFLICFLYQLEKSGGNIPDKRITITITEEDKIWLEG